MKKPCLFISLFLLFFTSFIYSQNPLQPAGGPNPVTVRQFAYKPGGKVFLATQDRGILRSTDSGLTWKEVNKGINSLYGAKCLAVGPEGNIYGAYDFGFYRSTDNGDNWTTINEGYYTGTECITVDPGNGSIFIGCYDGVYKSTDKGESWSKAHNDYIVTAIVIDTASHYIYAGGYNGVSISDNNGQSWVKMNGWKDAVSITALSLDSKGTLYIGDFYGGLYKSTDRGFSFFPIINDIGLASSVTTMAINSDETVFIGTFVSGIYYSKDKGATWGKSNKGLRNLSISSISVSPEGHLFAGARYGCIYRSLDKGNNWQQLQISTSEFQTQVYSVFQNTDGDIFAVTKDWLNSKGIFRSSDKGKSWLECVNDLVNQGFNSVTINNQGTLFLCTHYGFFKSTDKGDSWTPINSTTLPEFQSMYVNSNGEIFGLTVYNELYRSRDNGVNWEWINHDFGPDEVKSFVISPNGQMFIATSREKGIFRSTNSGVSWSQVNSGLAGLSSYEYITVLVSDSKGQLYAGTTASAIYRSADNGDMWNKIYSGSDIPEIMCIGSNSNGKLIAGGYRNLLVSSNNGVSWIKTENPMEYSFISSVTFHPSGETFLGTSNGVYKLVDSLLTEVSINSAVKPAAFSLEPNYPNPFNPSTQITYYVAKAGMVSLKVYDVLGKKVAELVNKDQSAGKYTVKFDAGSLPSGIYIYELRANDFFESRKMMLIK